MNTKTKTFNETTVVYGTNKVPKMVKESATREFALAKTYLETFSENTKHFYHYLCYPQPCDVSFTIGERIRLTEMKNDFTAHNTGNLAIEHSRIQNDERMKPSHDGIVKAEANGIHEWLQWLKDGRLFVFHVGGFAQFLRINGGRFHNFQTDDSQGYLVPIKEIESQWFTKVFHIPYQDALNKYPLPKDYDDLFAT